MILAVITYIGFFEVADYESSIRFCKFEMADPIWRLGSKKKFMKFSDFSFYYLYRGFWGRW